ncbi:hypothetical protein CFP56_004188 [Quercus suber]|uniref:Uncharacterized protein n=1 Tax=Quercus suber TaxID=58331 RepID=A0AAW0LAY1_QUESU
MKETREGGFDFVDGWFGYVNNPFVGISLRFHCKISGSSKDLTEEMGDREKRERRRREKN